MTDEVKIFPRPATQPGFGVILPPDVVMIVGQDGNPVRIDRADMRDDHKMHPDADKYDNNGELKPEHRAHVPIPAKTPKNAPASAPVAPVTATTPPTDTTTAPIDAERAARIAKMSPGVVEDGGRFFVVDMNDKGHKVTDLDGIDANGYDSNKAGWDAVQALIKRPG